MNHLIVFSHLRWDFVYQRPQHLLSRLARRLPVDVIFVEEPVPRANSIGLEQFHPVHGVQVLRPHLTGLQQGFHDDHIPVLRELLAAFIRAHGITNYGLWFYTPMAMPLAAELDPLLVVYDCMDELSAFRKAPRQLVQRESALLREADLVFTGGRSLYEAKRARHERVHCLPSSVDAEHFSRAARASSSSLPASESHDHPPQGRRARLGFFGVIDERIDLPLIAALADARDDWQIVMVGPVAKIDPAILPRRANIQWMGQQRYEDLPDFVAEWDVCLLPFALNEATRFISPTKTLEYLAADRPVVGTPIRDVVDVYADVVAIAGEASDFVAACEAALRATPSERARASARRAAVVAGTSWERTVEEMAGLMEARLRAAQEVLQGRALPAVARVTQVARGVAPLPLPDELEGAALPRHATAENLLPGGGWAKKA